MLYKVYRALYVMIKRRAIDEKSQRFPVNLTSSSIIMYTIALEITFEGLLANEISGKIMKKCEQPLNQTNSQLCITVSYNPDF